MTLALPAVASAQASPASAPAARPKPAQLPADSMAGSETKVIEEKFITRNGNRQYWRTANFSSLTEPLLVRFVMNAKGQLMGIGMGLASTPPPIHP